MSKLLAVAALMLLSLTGPAHAATLVTDGDFVNSPTPPNGFTTFNSGSSFGPWSVTSGSVDLINTYWQSPSAVPNGGSVDLDGNAPGSIAQTFTAPAGTYALTFSLSGNPDGAPSTKSLQVDINGTSIGDFTYTIGSNSKTNMMYTPETVDFTSTGGAVTLSFLSLDTLPGFYGPVVGNVAVSAAPLPSAFWLFGSALAAFAAFAWMKSRRAVA